MYYITKNAVYDHGVFWIGESLAEGIAKCVSLASTDSDDHHDWQVRSIGEIVFDKFSGHEDDFVCHYTCKKTEALRVLSEAASAAEAI